jgi:hypothetical protein
MDKKGILLMLMLLLCGYNFKAQQVDKLTEGEVEYHFFFGSGKKLSDLEDKVVDSVNVKKTEKGRVKKLVSQIFANNRGVRHIIKFKNDKVETDIDVRPDSHNKNQFNLTQIVLEAFGNYYADLAKNVVYNELPESVYGGIVVKYNISDLKWNITDETREINGYKAIKATANYKSQKKNGKQKYKEVVAWFSEEIPLRVAPLGYYGLPGLVVQLKVNGGTFILADIRNKEVELNNKIKIQKAITEDQYMDLLDEKY